MLFIALDGPSLRGDPARAGVAQSWAMELSARHRRHGTQLGNHQRWFVNSREGLEVEHKFTLGNAPDIWELAEAVHRDVASGTISGWIPEHGNNGGFEQWDFLNHLFEITTPECRAGQIAFIPAVDGSWIIRRKWGNPDAEIRREQLTERVDLGTNPDLYTVVGRRYGLTPAWGGCYRRVRYNVLLESLRTGHIFSIMFDRCTDQSADGPHVPPLHQVEVEYVRSRTLRPPDPWRDGLAEEFDRLTDWTRRFLSSRGAGHAEDHRSKLSWLRPADKDHPP